MSRTSVTLPFFLALASCAHVPAPRAAPVPPATEAERVKPPAPGPQPGFELPPITRFELANGVKVALAERHDLPVVALDLVVLGGGTASDPQPLPGLANFTVGMLDEGAAGKSAEQFALETEKLGASVSAGAGTDAAIVSAASLKRVFDPVLGLVSDLTLRPDFPTADVERVRRETTAAVLRDRDQGPVIARLLFSQQLFPAHPYGARPRGTPASLAKISRDDLVRFYRTHFSPDRALLVVSGDITREELEPKLTRAFGDWRRPAEEADVNLPAPAPPPAAGVSLFDRPKAAQSSIVIGWVGLERTNPDYVATQVMNAIFGGLFESRLNMNLREAKHWAYGARASLEARRVPGPLLAAAEVQSDHTADALREILKEIAGMRDRLPTPEELEAAKNSLVRSLPQQFETVEGTAGSLAEVMLYGLPADYWEAYPPRVEAVTAQDVQRMAQKYLDPARLTVVVAGDLSSIAAPMAALGLAPKVVVRDAEGMPFSPEP